jgi:hypothetical protein
MAVAAAPTAPTAARDQLLNPHCGTVASAASHKVIAIFCIHIPILHPHPIARAKARVDLLLNYFHPKIPHATADNSRLYSPLDPNTRPRRSEPLREIVLNCPFPCSLRGSSPFLLQ